MIGEAYGISQQLVVELVCVVSGGSQACVDDVVLSMS